MDVKTPRGPMYRIIDGFTLNQYFSVELFRSALRYEPRTDDTFLVTFPKSGTIWLQAISYLVLHDGSPDLSWLEMHKSQPSLEMLGAEDVEKRVRPGLIKTHLNYSLVPKSPRAKYVWGCRNPKDVCVSFFYHTKNYTGYDFSDGKFEDYFEIFMQGANDFGDYFDYVLSWYSHRGDPNMLLINYEDIKTDPQSQVLKLAAFLGEQYQRKLMQDPQCLHRVLQFSTIDYMKGQLYSNYMTSLDMSLEKETLPPGIKHGLEAARKYPKHGNFFRKGEIGDWKSHFTGDMNRRMEKKIYEKLSGTEFIDLWKFYGVL